MNKAIVEEAGIEDSVKVAYVSIVHALSELEHIEPTYPVDRIMHEITHAMHDLSSALIWLEHWAKQNNGE